MAKRRSVKLRWEARCPDKHNASKRRRERFTNYYAKAYAATKRDRYHQLLAWWAVSNALRRGHITRPSSCENCKKTCKPQAHHEDYSKKLEVKWLCRGCHLEAEGKVIRVSIEGDAQ